MLGILFLSVMGLAAAGTVIIEMLAALDLVPSSSPAFSALESRRNSLCAVHATDGSSVGRVVTRLPSSTLACATAGRPVIAHPGDHLGCSHPPSPQQPTDEQLRAARE